MQCDTNNSNSDLWWRMAHAVAATTAGHDDWLGHSVNCASLDTLTRTDHCYLGRVNWPGDWPEDWPPSHCDWHASHCRGGSPITIHAESTVLFSKTIEIISFSCFYKFENVFWIWNLASFGGEFRIEANNREVSGEKWPQLAGREPLVSFVLNCEP